MPVEHPFRVMQRGVPILWSGPRAIQSCEPRQIRKEAAVSGPLGVPRVNLSRRSAHLSVPL